MYRAAISFSNVSRWNPAVADLMEGSLQSCQSKKFSARHLALRRKTLNQNCPLKCPTKAGELCRQLLSSLHNGLKGKCRERLSERCPKSPRM